MFSCQIRIRSFHRLQFQFWLKMAIKIGLENRDSRNFLVRRHPKFALACLNWMHAISLLRSKFHFVARKVFISLIFFELMCALGSADGLFFDEMRLCIHSFDTRSVTLYHPSECLIAVQATFRVRLFRPKIDIPLSGLTN